jgi:hypothetical protein
MTNFFTQAYKQAPWRREKRLSGAILMFVLLGAAVSMLYLFVINQKAAAGIQIQMLESQRRVAIRNIADLRNDLATITSASNMRARAAEMGFVPMNPEEALYIVIPGYHGRQALIPIEIQPQAPAPRPSNLDSYHTSLWDWIQNWINNLPEVAK